MSLMTHVLGILQDIPNPAPVDPTGGSKGIELLLSYVKWGALIVCGLVALASGGYMAWGSMSDRPDAAHKGKRAFLLAMIGVIASAIAIPMVNTVFGAAS
ncbi:MAG: hypothetical protein JXA67_22545 [Micromonosporaceae bacterium]|nr:hypothetical protein [Micromonosporaceae bacterium]